MQSPFFILLLVSSFNLEDIHVNEKFSLFSLNQYEIQGVQLKSGSLTKPWIFDVRCYL